MKVIAKKKGGAYLIEAEPELYWKFDLVNNTVWVNVNLQGQLARAPWENLDGTEEVGRLLELAKKAEKIVIKPKKPKRKI